MRFERRSVSQTGNILILSAVSLVSLYAYKYAELKSSFTAFKSTGINSLRLVAHAQQGRDYVSRQNPAGANEDSQNVGSDSVPGAKTQNARSANENQYQDRERAVENIVATSNKNDKKTIPG